MHVWRDHSPNMGRVCTRSAGMTVQMVAASTGNKRWLPVNSTIVNLDQFTVPYSENQQASMADTSMPSEDSIVILHGLKGRADLNGTKAVVLKAETPEEEVRVCVYKYMYDSVVYRVVLLFCFHILPNVLCKRVGRSLNINYGPPKQPACRASQRARWWQHCQCPIEKKGDE